MKTNIRQTGRARFSDGPDSIEPVETLCGHYPAGKLYRREDLPDGSVKLWAFDPPQTARTEDTERGVLEGINARNRLHYGQPPARRGA